ncbi:LytR C-terminal domain-containing protein, partial [Modestobacter sp. VKM Ac-2985]|uniref:LytR C-terminal domain-containing protein n=1 Tax=Modestobacter sp. VKM Ac-2985 TaxID=3004139 RepID=UPI0022AB972D
PEPATPPTSAPAPEPEPSVEPVPCGVEFEPVVVDVVDGTGDPALVESVTRFLTDAGLTLGTVRTAEVATSAIEHLDGQEEQVRQLAEPLGAVPLLRAATGEHLTVVLGSADAASLVEAMATLVGEACDGAPAEETD